MLAQLALRSHLERVTHARYRLMNYVNYVGNSQAHKLGCLKHSLLLNKGMALRCKKEEKVSGVKYTIMVAAQWSFQLPGEVSQGIDVQVHYLGGET